MEVLITVVIILIVCVGGYFYIKARVKQKQEEESFSEAVKRSENRVLASDPITRRDIEILREAGSIYFDQAVALRQRQVELGRNID